MKAFTLPEALALAPCDVLTKVTAEFGSVAVATALAHHTRRGLTANIVNGTTRDRTGQRSRFIGYDWADTYTARPDHIWPDFFGPAVGNSASRISRGLTP